VLSYLHGLQPPIIYRDLKPSNVMLTSNGRVVLVDFGIARLFKAQRKGTMIGTLGFAPPEQYQGIADPRGDLYSLGATLHYVLTGRDPEKFPPFSFPPVRELRSAVSSNLAGAIDRALSYEMANRPATIQEFRDMLLYGRGLGTAVGQVNSRSGTAGLAIHLADSDVDEVLKPLEYPRKNGARRVAGWLVAFMVLAGLAFGATYVYNDPELQHQLGIAEYVNQLPWKHEELVAKARSHPLDFKALSLALSTRSGEPVSASKSSFTDTELAANRYLKWDASFANQLAGLDSQEGRVEARIFDPKGVQIASSQDQRFIAPRQTAVDFSGVAMMPDSGSIAIGNYKIALYSADELLGQSQFSVSEDLAAKAAAARAKAQAAAAMRAAEAKRDEETHRLAMVQERLRRPLQLEQIVFLNTTKDGTALSPPASVFGVSKVLFVGWRVIFGNRLFRLDSNRYQVDAAYLAPDGSALGSVQDVQVVSPSEPRATFSGRVGNSRGGAFLPGKYTVNFYLNGQYFAKKTFSVVNDAGIPVSGGSGPVSSSSGASSSAVGLEMPVLASGTIEGFAGRGSVPIDLRLRPQPNGFLDGTMVVRLSGYGPTEIKGFVRGDNVLFEVAYGAETFSFQGQRNRDLISGTFHSSSGQTGSWRTHAD
jgi:hypothetical protein